MCMNKDSMLNLAMLIVRVIVGGLAIVHGSQKLFGMFDGIGIDGTAKMIEGFGFPEPYVLAVAWAAAEFAGGIFLVFGILARLAATAVFALVVIQLWKANLTFSLLLQSSEIEYNLLVIAACIPVMLLGGGSWSVWDV